MVVIFTNYVHKVALTKKIHIQEKMINNIKLLLESNTAVTCYFTIFP